MLKCARQVVTDFDGVFPNTPEALQKLPGIGPYTSAAISSIAFNVPATVVDGNVERVMARMFDIHVPLPTSKPILTEHAAGLTPQDRPGDYAQAVMDLGATICTPRSPACGICPWRDPCVARQKGTAADLPKKEPKKPKPVRYGIAYVASDENGAVLLETRPDKGLLGGMLGWPGTAWAETAAVPAPPCAGGWTQSPIEVRHTFTHFHLVLTVMTLSLTGTQAGFMPRDQFRPANLPTVMRKVWDAANRMT